MDPIIDITFQILLAPFGAIFADLADRFRRFVVPNIFGREVFFFPFFTLELHFRRRPVGSFLIKSVIYYAVSLQSLVRIIIVFLNGLTVRISRFIVQTN